MEKKDYTHARRSTIAVKIGPVTIGGGNPVAVQSMTDTDTNDTDACVAQIGRIRDAGGRVVRLTAQGVREGENLANIAAEVKRLYPDVGLVADIHFLPQVALIAARYVDKVRINPGNFNDRDGQFDELIALCKKRGVSLRIGVNHGSLSEKMVSLHGDTPRGMVASAMEFLFRCRDNDFDQVVVSMKSSNTRVMVHAYRMLVEAMDEENMHYPIHLGVTEAGNGLEGRIKSAVGIGAMLADGIGDTIRVSLTEPPENEIPVALAITRYFEQMAKDSPAIDKTEKEIKFYNPYEYSRRITLQVGKVGGDNLPVIMSELSPSDMLAVREEEIALLTADYPNPVAQWRSSLAAMEAEGDRRPVILHRRYDTASPEELALMAAADFGVMFIDGLADGIYIESEAGLSQEIIDEISLGILQASRARMSKTEFIACPGCGRTLFNLHETLDTVKSRTSHLKGLKIGVMGCIVNGPGEMADADYGYVGAAPGHISLYRGRELIKKNIPQSEALDELIELIKSDGKWVESEN